MTVRGLTFTYPGADEPVLRDVDLTIPAGGSLALVGATGAGKSTLAALVAGIGTPQAGSVRVGPADLAELDEAGARALVSILTQETHVFSGPLADDLRLAAPGPPTPNSWTPCAPSAPVSGWTRCPTGWTHPSVRAASAST